ncbi:uncharacterized protein LOC129228572 [Uloborus diversus]|uniref:uncharacterized protein LOC129228572 n=1 Tax=Uloborus diversus TaxID=327109 RepID=UPI002409A2F9|nr:uncharacterized protein LOC129228572 [Uloborus diversus]
MNEMLATLFQPNVPLRSKVSYLNSALSGHTFRAEPDHLKELITKIVELIVSEKTQCEGLALLENALQQCPLLYADNKWSNALLSVLRGRNAPACKELACKCLIMIVENYARNAAHEPEARNTLVPAIIKDVIPHVDDTDAWLYHALRLIAVCMKNFPNAVATQKLE